MRHQKSEHGLRPSDKTGALRDYGLLDRDLWGLGELRGWFNKNAPEAPRATSAAGRTRARHPTPQLSSRTNISILSGPRHTNRFTRPRTAVRLPPAGVVPGKVTNSPIHWIDHENNLAAQTQVRANRSWGGAWTPFTLCVCVRAAAALSTAHKHASQKWQAPRRIAQTVERQATEGGASTRRRFVSPRVAHHVCHIPHSTMAMTIAGRF